MLRVGLPSWAPCVSPTPWSSAGTTRPAARRSRPSRWPGAWRPAPTSRWSASPAGTGGHRRRHGGRRSPLPSWRSADRCSTKRGCDSADPRVERVTGRVDVTHATGHRAVRDGGAPRRDVRTTSTSSTNPVATAARAHVSCGAASPSPATPARLVLTPSRTSRDDLRRPASTADASASCHSASPAPLPPIVTSPTSGAATTSPPASPCSSARREPRKNLPPAGRRRPPHGGSPAADRGRSRRVGRRA